jgi:hypothetical protein
MSVEKVMQTAAVLNMDLRRSIYLDGAEEITTLFSLISNCNLSFLLDIYF